MVERDAKRKKREREWEMIRLFTIFSVVYYNKGSVYYTLPYYIHKLFLESHAFRSKISYVYGVQQVVCTN